MHLPKSRRVLGSLLVLFITFPAAAVSATSAGQPCQKAGAVSSTKSGGKTIKLVCTKVGKRLVWVTRENNATVPVGNGAYSIGDVGPGGGFVFYDAGSHQPWGRYLEAAPADSSTGVIWCNKTSFVGTLLKVGTGQANTLRIIAHCSSGAARSADKYVAPNGTADWFLPSRDELNLMYTNLARRGIGGFATDYYWCSSEDETGSAWDQLFANGAQEDRGSKNDVDHVRPARAFG